MRFKHFTLHRQQYRGTGDFHALFQGYRTYECYRCKCSMSNLILATNQMKKCESIIHRPVKCDLCNMQFKNRISFQTHLRRIHSIYEGKRKKEQMLIEAGMTFECIDCKARFLDRPVLHRHTKINRRNRVFKCD